MMEVKVSLSPPPSPLAAKRTLNDAAWIRQHASWRAELAENIIAVELIGRAVQPNHLSSFYSPARYNK